MSEIEFPASSSTHVEFIPAAPQFAEVIALHRHFQPEVPQDAKDAYAQWVRGAIEREVYRGWLAVQDRSVVGGAGLVLLDWGPTRDDLQAVRARVVNVWVDPAVRRRGIARRLTQLALECSQSLGIRTVSLSSTALSKALYESLGFTTAAAEMTCKLPQRTEPT